MSTRKVPLLDLDWRYLRYLWPYGRQLALATATMAAVAALDVASPWPLKFIVDDIIGGHVPADPAVRAAAALFGGDPRVLALVFGALIIVLAALGGLFSFLSDYVQGTIQERTTFRLRSDAFAHLQNLSLRFHDRSRAGEVISRVNGDAGQIMDALVGSTGQLVVNAFTFLGIAAMMLSVNWRFSLIALAYAPLLLFLFSAFRRNIKRSARLARDQEGQMTAVTHETVAAIRVIKAFGREADGQRRFDEHGRARIEAGLRAVRWEAAFGPVVDVAKAAGVAAVVWYGTAQIFAGQLTVGELLVFLSYLGMFYRPLRQFSKLAGALQKSAASGERLAELLDNDLIIPDAPGAARLGRAAGRVDLERVSFAYEGGRLAVRDVSFTALPGQTIALVGATGAGKTTLANLLVRFYDVTAGRVLLDGMDVRGIRLADLRRQCALVPQEPILFATSLYDNIAYGRPDATGSEIIAAAQAANAHEFIQQLPQGYATVVGERGATLSGGQRQRIAIARALLRNAPILILDEPTSALDAGSEHEVLDALARLRRGRTTFVIAHRLSTTRDADLILVMNDGQIVERGKHGELLARGGLYAEYVGLQQDGMLAARDRRARLAGRVQPAAR